MTDEKKITSEESLSYEQFYGRLSSPAATDLMYARDAVGRTGLEVLWLKLSLLAELIGIARTARINLNRCKIKLTTATHLPRLWNFSVESVRATDASVQVVLQEMGVFWFRTLLASPGQTAAEVDGILESLLAASGGNSHSLIDAALHSPAMQSKTVPADLWQRALQIGLRLATRIPDFSYSSHAEDTLDAVLGRVWMDSEALRLRLQTALFVDPPRMEQDLGELLSELIRDPGWLNALGVANATQVERPSPPPVIVIEPPEDNMESTIIIKRGAAIPSSPAPIKPAAASPAPAQPSAAPAQENLEATIIISKDRKR